MRRTAPVADVADALTDALAAGGGRLPEDVVARATQTLERARERLGLAAGLTVVALAGATGSGKSSLFNAVAGTELAVPGALRPTTSRALAAVWADDPDAADALLDWLEVDVRHRPPVPPARTVPTDLLLLDLPDHDSVVAEHRAVAERLYERVDLLVWVLDPQKYADGVLHERYLRPLAPLAGVMVLALNHADRVPAPERSSWLADARRLAAEDGLRDVPVLAVSARTGEGVDALRDLLVEAARRREAAGARVRGDLRAAAAEVVAACGTGAAGRADARPLVDAFEAAAGVPAVVQAVRGSALRRARAHTGWPPLRWLARWRPDPLRRLHLRVGAPDPVATGRTSLPTAAPAVRARAATAVRGYVDAATAGLPEEWVLGTRGALREAGATGEVVADALDTAVAGTELLAERPALWWRVVGALQWVLLAAAVVGLGWLGALAGAAYLQLPVPRTPEWGPLPVPTALVAGGVLVGLLLALLSALLARVGARRRAARARRRLRTAVAGVAERLVVEPVAADLDRLRRCRDRASEAAAG
ncbi:GTPase [Cellulomonas endophytica]|uniref:GTPase n=1 Tax=Cellulomonas endophytica TaxID=2494735 RepID=UPI0010131025|nr:GTPase [Cellulomonas endophytica]